jgi:hypothetical protein
MVCIYFDSAIDKSKYPVIVELYKNPLTQLLNAKDEL